MRRLGKRKLGAARRATVALLLLCVGGCATVREARRAQDVTQVPPGERTVDAASVGLTAATVLSLDSAIDLALRFHPAVVQARNAVASAELAVDSVRAGLRPSVSASASTSRGTSNRQGSSFSGSSDPSYGAGLSLDLLLLDFGKSRAQERQALEALIAAEEERRSVENETRYGVRSAFLDVLRSLAMREVAVENYAQVSRQLDLARTLAEFGRRQPYDVTRARVALGTAALETIAASNSVTSARATLNRSLGLAEDPGYGVVACDLTAPPRDVAALVETARTGNPELAALAARARAATAAVDAAIAQLYPDLRISADAALSGAAFPLAANLSGAARASAPLWDGGTRRNRIQDSVLQLRSARARHAAMEQQLFQEISVAVSQYEAAEARLTVTEETAAAASENALLTAERYRLGAASAIEQADAQTALTGARAERIRARCDRWLAVASIARLTGSSVESSELAAGVNRQQEGTLP